MEKINKLYGINFDVEYYKDYIDIILDIFDNDNLNYDLTDDKILTIIGLYYKCKIKNYDKMEKYYLMAIELNNCRAMHNLGYNYQFIEENYDEMKKYYLMAIKLNNELSIKNLCCFYNIEIQHYLLKQINSIIAIEKVKELEKNNFKELKF